MAAHDRDKAMAGLLRQTLQADAGSQDPCPGPDILAAYYERSLAPDETPVCELHISGCARCRAQLSLMARTEAPSSPAARHGWLLDWRLLVAATAALIVVTVWGLHRPVLKSAGNRSASEPLVAMSKDEQGVPSQRAQASPSAPPSEPAPAHESRSRKQLDVDNVSRQLQAPSLEAPVATQKKLSRDLPEVASSAEDSLKLRSDRRTQLQQDAAQQNTRQQNEVQHNKVQQNAAQPGQLNRLAAQNASEALDEKAAPSAAAQLAAPPPAANVRAPAMGGMIAPGGSAGAAAISPRAKESQPATLGGAGAVSAGAFAQTAQQRSAETIIRTPDPKVLWRIAGGGFIERSENGGASWHGQLPEPNAQFSAGAAPTTKALWLVGENGMILLTKDASNWKMIPPPIPADFVSVDAKSGSSATVTAADGQKFSTSNSGKRWMPAR
jgi:hypothetical protein